jgi:hypothetical protein
MKLNIDVSLQLCKSTRKVLTIYSNYSKNCIVFLKYCQRIYSMGCCLRFFVPYATLNSSGLLAPFGASLFQPDLHDLGWRFNYVR